jgi:predicted dehydrogenase
MEAMHYLYHPLARLMTEQLPVIAADGSGFRHIRCAVAFPLSSEADIRYDYDLGGGATMDAGCYAIDLARLLGPGEPMVTRASATELGRYVDKWMTAFLEYPGGGTAELDLAFDPPDRVFRAEAQVTGSGGEMMVENFIHPHNWFRLTVSTPGAAKTLTGDSEPAQSTYAGQLRAFAGAVLRGEPFPTTASHAVVTMGLIDDIYRAAGLPPRP